MRTLGLRCPFQDSPVANSDTGVKLHSTSALPARNVFKHNVLSPDKPIQGPHYRSEARRCLAASKHARGNVPYFLFFVGRFDYEWYT